MSKITKKELHNGWHCHDTEIIKMKKELRELKQSVLRLEKLTDEKLLDEPQLKQLDQSVFDGLDEKWRFAAVDECGEAYVYTGKPEIDEYGICFIDDDVSECKRTSSDYDATNWKESLIERESKELTGSELCKAMLERGDKYVMCFVSGMSDAKADSIPKAITSFNSLTRQFRANHDIWRYAVPINNQGEPLTASEVGL